MIEYDIGLGQLGSDLIRRDGEVMSEDLYEPELDIRILMMTSSRETRVVRFC